LPLRDAGIGASVVTHALSGEPGFFMLMITPPAAEREITIPRDVTLILDTSGSGGKIAQARDALDQILGSLTGDDRFRLITFNSVVREFRQGFADADPATVRAAREFLAGVRADGSTNVADALRTALEPEATEDRLSLIVFLTDGKPTVGETSPEAIAEMARRIRDRERVFAFGVGHDV
ncbi:MAG: VWA domain-containing protein, partial [Gammaproteobacteria bacterium]|nr:VWA domain-containing protein [Gemmatimonadota bacterium]NIU75339.1 VWA domain-containing protein [Gammaproteobacteria bacterium]NIX23678.1 VWA domain-containing protein [Actinomycetota bacterium]